MILLFTFTTASSKKSGQFLGIDSGLTSSYSELLRSGAHFFFKHDRKSLLTPSTNPLTYAAYAGVTILTMPSCLRASFSSGPLKCDPPLVCQTLSFTNPCVICTSNFSVLFPVPAATCFCPHMNPDAVSMKNSTFDIFPLPTGSFK